MASYLVCGDGDQDVIDDAKIIDARDPKEAAEQCFRLNHGNWDYPNKVDLFVKREGSEDQPLGFVVYAVPDIKFVAVEAGKERKIRD